VEPGVASRLAMLLSIMLILNLVLLVFNLLPLPPLDGSAIWPVLLSPSQLMRYREYAAQPAFVLLGLIVAWRLLDYVFPPVFVRVMWLLYG
jgi:Zn-dependent protease